MSDFHIGAKTFDDDALLDFLRSVQTDYLYLVGDIIDGWKLNKRWYWTDTINDIFDELFRKAAEGTKIIYISGNHDDVVRKIPMVRRLRFARRLNIQIRNRVIHKGADGREFLILHGDQFDRILLRGPVSRLSDRLYDLALEIFARKKPLNIEINGKIKRFSLAKFLAYKGQFALNILNNFETSLCREARRSDVDGIICGHTHIPALKHLKGMVYANCGSWLTKRNTAVVEQHNGSLELIDWPSTVWEAQEDPFLLPIQKTQSVKLVPDAYAYRPFTLRLVASIRRAWPSPHTATTLKSPCQRFSLIRRPFKAVIYLKNHKTFPQSI